VQSSASFSTVSAAERAVQIQNFDAPARQLKSAKSPTVWLVTNFYIVNYNIYYLLSDVVHYAFSALTLLVGRQEGIRPVKTEWWGAGVVICLERCADLHMAQLMPLPLTVSCFCKIQIGFTFLVLAHLGSPGQRAVKWVCVPWSQKKLQEHLTTAKNKTSDSVIMQDKNTSQTVRDQMSS